LNDSWEREDKHGRLDVHMCVDKDRLTDVHGDRSADRRRFQETGHAPTHSLAFSGWLIFTQVFVQRRNHLLGGSSQMGLVCFFVFFSWGYAWLVAASEMLLLLLPSVSATHLLPIAVQPLGQSMLQRRAASKTGKQSRGSFGPATRSPSSWRRFAADSARRRVQHCACPPRCVSTRYSAAFACMWESESGK